MIYIIKLTLILTLVWSCRSKENVIPVSTPLVAKTSVDSINEWKSGFFVSWRGTQNENIRSAKALGYRYINETCEKYLSSKNYGPMPEAKGMRFYLDNPEYSLKPELDYLSPAQLASLKAKTFGALFRDYPAMNIAIKEQWLIDLKTDNPAIYERVKATYEKWCLITDGVSQFPKNLALGWVFSDGTARIVLDWQQKKVIDLVIGNIVKLAHERENKDNDYLFTGITMDAADKQNEFSRAPAYRLNYHKYTLDPALTGYQMPGTQHDYATFREGWSRFMIALRNQLTTEFADRKIRFIIEPWKIWRDGYCGWWGYWIDTIDGAPFLTFEEKKQIAGDLVSQEGDCIEEFDDQIIINKITKSGLISFDNLASSSPNLEDRYSDLANPSTHLNYLGKLATKGLWFNSYGRFDSGATTIKQRLPQLTLCRLVVNWQNLAKIPIKDRIWDETNQVYDSPTGHADKDIIYGKEPHSGKYYTVWVNKNGIMKLQKGEKIISARAANEYYEENGANSSDATSSLITNQETISLSGSGKLNKCYIITVSK